ncbi:ATP-dependent Clp protease proteolytic subunit [Rubrivirga marina]|uniref:ATP-dependent Clp protease proteolytic subunit n=1 Tax=Rubrivirga marina TaxID=1196024 RepID=A0A271J671_9BACT|nr:ATP-dependent Clp protease proteolytic subunit [Rubrivirga marina]PAP78149.1 ATP-dependent Clp protease proteolytic subunit [Rubrivirga marina]
MPDDRDEPLVLPTPLSRRVDDALFDARTVVISGGIDQDLAGSVIARLTALSAASADDVTIVVNSPGGHVESGDTIHDFVRFVTPRVRMLGTGWVASAGALIYVAVPREGRFCLPNTRFLLHEPSGGVRGVGSDIEIEADQILRMRERLTQIFARQTGQPVERIREDTRRNFWLDAEAAVEYGLVGRIVESASEMA